MAYNPTTSGRHPISLGKSINGGKDFKDFIDLDSIDKSLAYPTSVQVMVPNSNPLIFTDFSADTHTGIKLAMTSYTV